MLIASRRQVDGPEFGGGYVENWTTDAFARYVRDRVGHEFVSLCRDHGGPWQHPSEFSLRTEQAVISSAVASIEADIAAGFELIHIDTSRGPNGAAEPADAISRLVAIYGAACERARSLGREVAFEIGFESQGTEVGDPAEFSDKLDEVLDRLGREHLPQPRFVVAQTGTKVSETRNVGDLTKDDRRVEALQMIRLIAGICHSRGVLLKAHNVDYLDARTRRKLIANGADAINVAPEFGVLETRTLLRSMRALGHGDAANEIIDIAVASRRWISWTDSPHLLADIQKAELAGHYVFAHPRVQELRFKFNEQIHRFGMTDHSTAALTRNIGKYLSTS